MDKVEIGKHFVARGKVRLGRFGLKPFMRWSVLCLTLRHNFLYQTSETEKVMCKDCIHQNREAGDNCINQNKLKIPFGDYYIKPSLCI